MPFISVALTHELRLEEYQQHFIEQNDKIIELLKLLVLISEEHQPTAIDISEAQT